MTRRIWAVALALLYLATGLFIVPANEKAVVRRFGRVILPPRVSGLHLDWPWPLTRIDRVNFNEVRTLSLGDIETDSNFLQRVSGSRPMMFLTGDKNLLLLRISVQYRISEAGVVDWLYGSQSSVQRLQSLVETTAADLVGHSGVDFVHTLGLAEFNNRLLENVRQQTANMHLGCDVEQVTVDRAEPPARVKAEFLDVSNARADRARSMHEARSYAEQKLAESQADARKIADSVEQGSRARVSAAHGSADRFEKLISQIRFDSESSGRSYEFSKGLVMNRLFLETIRSAFEKSKLKIVLDGEKPFDLTFPQ